MVLPFADFVIFLASGDFFVVNSHTPLKTPDLLKRLQQNERRKRRPIRINSVLSKRDFYFTKWLFRDIQRQKCLSLLLQSNTAMKL